MLSVSNYDKVTVGDGRVAIPGIFSLRVFLYHLDGLLIDTGPSRLSKAIRLFVMQYKPEQVAVTHTHEDHCGLASWINEKFPSTPIYTHPSGVQFAGRPACLPFYRRIFWGKREPFKARPYDGEVLRTDRYLFRVIHVGGHCPDHVVLYEERKGWLFTGDLFVTPYPRIGFFEENYSEHIKALEFLLSLKPEVIFCAHSGVHREAQTLLKERLDYLKEIRSKVVELRNAGLSDEKIVKIIFPQKPPIVYLSRGEWSAYHIVRSL
ncbi:MBL fold metallo-hydrolase [Thermodesulforhabdus norvegica]|uniref:Glyoxylase, beta-lactamase superfamily II n=1 Tax=Thermodesulforhabdus norvegica TaxID=39841 RepID=A0A1I4S8Y9_9BACT|nr:MBL fold metallo-hydrolase [Thermodesulforhabdus norvegica]SFM60750.1 Glyoxylase, beta-lactamase superfamily II [Thermodesulforhabdus norvegica]